MTEKIITAELTGDGSVKIPCDILKNLFQQKQDFLYLSNRKDRLLITAAPLPGSRELPLRMDVPYNVLMQIPADILAPYVRDDRIYCRYHQDGWYIISPPPTFEEDANDSDLSLRYHLPHIRETDASFVFIEQELKKLVHDTLDTDESKGFFALHHVYCEEYLSLIAKYFYELGQMDRHAAKGGK